MTNLNTLSSVYLVDDFVQKKDKMNYIARKYTHAYYVFFYDKLY